MGSLIVRRIESGARDRLRAYKVLIDDLEVGKLKRGESASFELRPGSHTVQVAVDWKRSASFGVSGDGEEAHVFRCEPRGGALKAAGEMLNHADDTWLFLEPDTDERNAFYGTSFQEHSLNARARWRHVARAFGLSSGIECRVQKWFVYERKRHPLSPRRA